MNNTATTTNVNGWTVRTPPPAYTRTDWAAAEAASISYEPTEQALRYEEEGRLALLAQRAEVLNPDETVTVRMAYTFYADHVSRDLPAGKLLSHKGNFATVELDYIDFAEMLSDAKFYAGDEDDFDRALVDSAKRVVVALNKISTPWIKAN